MQFLSNLPHLRPFIWPYAFHPPPQFRFRNFGYNHVRISIRSTGQAVLGLFIISGFCHSFWPWVNLIKLQYSYGQNRVRINVVVRN